MVMRERSSKTTELRRQARDLALVGKYRKAAQLYQQLLERSPRDAQAALRLAEMRRRIGDPSGARSAYQQAIALYLDAGWDSKALGVGNALDRLEDPPVRWGRLRTFFAKIFHAARFWRPT